MWPHWAKFPKVLHIYGWGQIFWGGQPIVCWTLEILPTIVTVETGFKQSWKSGPYLGTQKRTKLWKNMSVYLVTEKLKICSHRASGFRIKIHITATVNWEKSEVRIIKTEQYFISSCLNCSLKRPENHHRIGSPHLPWNVNLLESRYVSESLSREEKQN